MPKDVKDYNKSKPKTRSKSKSKRTKKEIMEKEIGKDNIPTLPNGPTSNDPSWYIYDDTMFNGVISMPTLDFKGVKSPWKPNVQYAGEVAHFTDNYIGAPTLNVLYMNPSASYNGSDFASSPVNIAARKMYAELSASNAKTSGYAPQDVATLILALGQIIAMAHFIRRAYGITNYYNFYNRTIPKALMAAHGVSNTDVERWTSRMADLRNRVNQLIARIDSIQFPGNLNYFRKCEYIYHNVFVDRDDQMPTYSMMAPWSTWMIDEESYDQGTILKTTDVCATPDTGSATKSISNYIAILDEMLDKVLTSATFNYIFADVINLANRNIISSDFIHVPMLEIDYSIEPLYSEQYNWQIMNASILGVPKTEVVGEESTPSNDVYPVVDDNCIKYAPSWSVSGVPEECSRAYDLPIRIPDVGVNDDEFVELLAYHNTPTLIKGPSLSEVKYVGISDYYVVQYNVWNGNNWWYELSDKMKNNIYPLVGESSTSAMISSIAKMLNIVHAPLLGCTLPTAGTTDPSLAKAMIWSKLGSYTMVDPRSISNLRQEIFLGLFKFTN